MRRINAVTAGMALLLAPAMINPGLATADQRTGSAKAIDYVVQRALSQQGVPFVYGGGGVNGPTNGIRPDSKTPSGGITTAPGAVTVPRTATSPGSPGTVPGTFQTPGTATTPDFGAAPSANIVGFDASGLVQYAFAGAGIKMPRTSGEQCNVGRKVPPAQARRGDLICYGPGGSQSVALYLGNGQMIEGTTPTVTVSAARTSNMSPYLTRIIE